MTHRQLIRARLKPNPEIEETNLLSIAIDLAGSTMDHVRTLGRPVDIGELFGLMEEGTRSLSIAQKAFVTDPANSTTWDIAVAIAIGMVMMMGTERS